MFETSACITTISKALLGVQNEFLAIKKEAKGKHNKFAEYPELIKKCKPILTNAGVILMQPVTHIIVGDLIKPSISTLLIHSDSGEFFKSTSIVTPMTERKNSSGDSILSHEQLVGGGITYQKRYDLVCMLAWATGEYDLDQSFIDQQDKQTEFILKSFHDLLNDYNKDGVLNQEFCEYIMDSVKAVDGVQGKKKIYSHFKNVILPKGIEDEKAAFKMLNSFIAEL